MFLTLLHLSGGPFGPPVCFEGPELYQGAESGLYIEGMTRLHRLDPRVKFAASLLLVVLSFSASTGGQLLWVAMVFVCLFFLLREFALSIFRVLWKLRWLILFSFLLHLLFTPGRTLWGTRWISYDGFLVGSFVSAQILLAVFFASVFALTTRIELIVAAVGWFARPLKSIGLNVSNFEKLVLLVLRFLPIVHGHIGQVAAENDLTDDKVSSSFLQKWRIWAIRVRTSIISLIDQGDEIAHELAQQEQEQDQVVTLPGLFSLPSSDLVAVLWLVTILCVYWLIGVSA